MNISDVRGWAHMGTRDIFRPEFGMPAFGSGSIFKTDYFNCSKRHEAHTGYNMIEEVMQKIEIYNSCASPVGFGDYY